MIAPGTRLGAYEIVSALGSGGMGDVYRARDTRLNRDVAIKVLPDLFASDPDRLARFEREAQAVAALSHPNILAIHDFSHTNGVPCAVMELLEGETLRERLAEGPLSPRRAVEYASQIARGLAAAHEKGIVHRDLKPENVFVTTSGHVKILDFGLARHAAPAGSAADRTRTLATDAGVVMGTVGYMSPEQVRGEVVDHRSDIFSFGVLVFEMLSGRRAFIGETAAETMTAILREDPPDLSGSGRAIPPALARIVQHCLEKRPEERFQSARDLAFDLQNMDAGVAAGVPQRPRARQLLPLAGLLAIGIVAGLLGRLTAPAAARSEWEDASFRAVTVSQALDVWPSLAPDGKSFAYASRASGNSDIYVQRIGGHNATNLTADSPDVDEHPAFSPDGSLLAFHSTRGGGGIFVMGATGESVRRVADSGYNPAWSPDGRSLVVSETTFHVPQDRPTVGQLWVITLENGAKRPLPTGDAVQPAWSPDGARIAYWGNAEGGRRDIWTIAADGRGAPVPVTSDAAVDWSPVWSPDGRWLYFSSDRNGAMNIWRVAVRSTTGEVIGEPSPVAVPSASVGAFSVSRDGKTLLFGTHSSRTTLHAVMFDPASGGVSGTPQVVLQGAQQIDYIDISPDGRWIAFGSADRQEDLFLVRTDGTGYRQLTDDPHRDRGPRWSPDGSRLAFYSNRQGPYEIWSIRPDGSGLELLGRMKDARGGLVRPAWAPDGQRLSAKKQDGVPIMIDLKAPLDVRATPWNVDAEPGSTLHAWSPDGRRLAGTIDRGPAAARILVYTTDGKKDVVTMPAPVWEGSLAWLADSRRLLFTTHAAGILLLDFASGHVREVLPRSRNDLQIPVLAVSRDNRVVVYTEAHQEGDLWVMERR